MVWQLAHAALEDSYLIGAPSDCLDRVPGSGAPSERLAGSTGGLSSSRSTEFKSIM